ncbi:TMAO reductase system periplasmic protein TorT [Vibrio azureus]|uniref:Periplasmic protein TorT n=1 Tax=Vibrio azureus NBRC 104587 TaxID=1219077 RepID=U3C8R2_9VIBR|nr:TMAO reductase system periplasmic protein TorT [Vibrio azureus]AUI87843.1 TMAO reductase system periplasmic protein TorT [Vibrio azureus]GAD74803.1 periplasmic protein TorT [Vibrio azureus NBRC 104587]
MYTNNHRFSLFFRHFVSCLLFITLVPSAAAEKLCAIYPHLKDSYWLSINYGMVSEAEDLGIELRVMESGGYNNISKQEDQLTLCRQWGADAILLGTVSPNAYETHLGSLVGDIPVFTIVNQLNLDASQSEHLKGGVGIDWYWMGYEVGKYLTQKHPKGSGQTNIALLLGPRTKGGTKPVTKGVTEAIKNSDIKVKYTYWADNDKELQRNLVQRIIDTDKVDYIVGSAVAIEAAISELRTSQKAKEIGLISVYLSHGIYRGLIRHKVEFAPTDNMVTQGRLSVKQALQYLRGEKYQQQISLPIQALTSDSLSSHTIEDSLSPSEYRPVFNVKPVVP